MNTDADVAKQLDEYWRRAQRVNIGEEEDIPVCESHQEEVTAMCEYC